MTHTVNDLIAERFGGSSRERENDLVTQVGVDDVIIARSDPKRFALTVVNQHATQSIRIRPSKAATATVGIVLGPGGGVANLNWENDLGAVTREWHAIATGAATDVYVLEELLVGGDV